MSAPQGGRGLGVGARTAGGKREHLDLGPAVASQRRDLVGDETSEGGALGTRVHVGDDERAPVAAI
jgi:hypothetical protein